MFSILLNSHSFLSTTCHPTLCTSTQSYSQNHRHMCTRLSLTTHECQMNIQELYSTVPYEYQHHCPAIDTLPQQIHIYLHSRVGSLLPVSDTHIKDDHPTHTTVMFSTPSVTEHAISVCLWCPQYCYAPPTVIVLLTLPYRWMLLPSSTPSSTCSVSLI